jgi:peptidoglycan/LPS O-acetylase OafA/YrhL
MSECNRNFSTALNCCRWVAALFVVLQHIRHLLLIDYEKLQHKNLFFKAFYFLTGLGTEAVIVFFVISGFLVGGGALKKYFNGRYDAKDYAIHRISRIYTVLIPALLFGCMLDFIGFTYFNQSMIYTNAVQSPISDVIANNVTTEFLIGNVLMLQGLFVPVLGSNGPLWSLAFEWWYYCIFWAILGIASSSSMARRLVYGAFVLASIILLPTKLLLWFLLWLMGVALAWAGSFKLKIHPILGLLVFGGVLVCVRLSYRLVDFPGQEPLYIAFFRDFAVAIGCFVLLVSLSRIQSFRLGSANFHSTMTDFSYTTYLVHFPMLTVLGAFVHDYFGIRFDQQPTLVGGLYFLALLSAIYLYSYLFAKLTEGNTGRVRDALRTLFGGKSQSPLQSFPGTANKGKAER